MTPTSQPLLTARRYSIAAVSCRVTAASGSNTPAPRPSTIPSAAAQATAFAYQLPSWTSTNAARPGEAGAPSMRHSTVTSIARVSVPSGSKSVSVTPFMSPASYTCFTAS